MGCYILSCAHMSPQLIKRLLLIFGLLVVSALVGFGIYAVFFRSTTTTVQINNQDFTNTSGQLPTSSVRSNNGNGTTTSESGTLPLGTLPENNGSAGTYFQEQPVVQLTNDYPAFANVGGGSVRYYNQADGKFYHVSANGAPIALSDQVFYNAQNVTWAKNQDKAVIEYPDGAKIVYDFTTKKQVSLPQHWQDFSFSSDGAQIAAKSMGLSPDNRWLITTKDDGTGTQALEPLGNNGDKVIVDWSPSRQTVALSRTGEPVGGERQEVLFVGLHGENFKPAIVEGLDFQSNWSPTGQKLLYSIDNSASSYKPDLWIVDAYGDSIGNNRKQLQLNTWAHKCSFADENTLFCAVPETLPDGAGMSPAIAKDTPDQLYKIDIRTGLKQPIPLDNEYTIQSISFDKNSGKLFFTDPHRTGIFQVNI